jgi:hypothetical protein
VKYHSWEISTHVSRFRGTRFDSQPQSQINWGFYGFCQSLQANVGIMSQVRNLTSFQIHHTKLSSHLMLYKICKWESIMQWNMPNSSPLCSSEICVKIVLSCHSTLHNFCSRFITVELPMNILDLFILTL